MYKKLFAAIAAILALVFRGISAEEQGMGPLVGAVTHGNALAEARLTDGGTYACVAPMDASTPAKRIFDGAMCSWPVRWHIAHNHFWHVYSIGWIQHAELLTDRECLSEGLDRYQLTDLVAGRAIAAPGADDQPTDGLFAPAEALGQWHMLDGRFEYRPRLHYDYLPVGEDKALLLVLTDARGHLKSAGSTGDLAGYHFVVSPEEAAHPKWSLTVHSCRSTWNAKKQQWRDWIWKREGSIDVGFTEGFHALAKDDDYYFITLSGKLYRAPKPDMGADRKMDTIWKDDKRPVVAFITDADADRSFLFCKPDKDGKGVYFELSDKPDPQPYDASKIPEAKPDDPLPAVLAYSKILLADKKIKDKEKEK